MSGERFDSFHGCFTHLVIVEPTFHQTIEAVDLARAADGDELDFLGVAWLEANGGAGRDVEPHAVGRRAIEREIAVDLEKMKMRSDLHRPIAAIADFDSLRRAAGVQLDRIGREKIFGLVSFFTLRWAPPPAPATPQLSS